MRTRIAVALLGALCFATLGRNEPLLAAPVASGGPLTGDSKAQPAPRKLALLVAVKEYDKPYPANSNVSRADSGWAPLNTELDVYNLKRTLTTKWSFKDADVLTIVDLKAFKGGQKMPYHATRAGIMRAWRDHFTKEARPGDVCVFMYSGHGQQVPDAAPNGDGKVVRDEKDGLDESFVTFNYKGASGRENAATNLRDDDLDTLLGELSAKMKRGGQVEGNITVIADSCHSGTISRGGQGVGQPIRKGRGWDTSLDGPLPRGATLSRGNPTLVSSEGSGLLKPGEARAEGYVTISACQSNQSAFETVDENGQSRGGALVYNLCKALEQAPAGTPPTYRDLFERLAVEIQANESRQFPAIEGDVDVPIFGGKAVPLVAYPRVQSLKEGQAVVNIGQMHGVTVKSRYNLYSPEVDPRAADAQPLVEGAEVTDSGLYESHLELPADTNLTEAQLRGAKVVLAEQAVDSMPLRVLLDGTGALEPKLAGAPDQNATASVLDFKSTPNRLSKGDRSPLTYDVRVTREALEANPNPAPSSNQTLGSNQKGAPEAASRFLMLRAPDGTLINAVRDDDEGAGKLREVLLGLWRIRYLQGLQNAGAANGVPGAIDVAFQIKRLPGRAITLGDKGGAESNLVVYEGEPFVFEIENRSSESVYVSILDLQTDGSISLFFPDWKRKAESDNYRLEPGGKLEIRAGVGAPFGRDVFKLIATQERVDFSPLVFRAETMPPELLATKTSDASRMTAKGAKHPLATLLFQASMAQARAATVLPEPAAWGTASVTVETRPRPTE